ncbi:MULTISPECIES: thiolase family protein [unclassified Lactobacillus]|uniref:thiolase family protein n=1 Tax=unclassified Lactobacillus TaxID=2620435 RepID=UPI0018DD573A|nr:MULTISPECIES: thiolase family protein [unclassified Lactobacillus]MBH9989972.1 thiolase family protein [Lactobacillus sp. M0392]MBI0024368.1 thiolase family protein [Lactobacillus sp. W8171]MBI0045010.1 thiolase family protein [Lactobacillus sp. M0393]
MKEIYIVAAKRTPFGRYHGLWAEKSAIDLGEIVLRETLKSINLNPENLEALFMGNVLGASLGQNMARQVALNTGMSPQSSSVTINEVCGSSLKALRLAQGQMEMGDFGLVAVGGAESMSNAIYLTASKEKPKFESEMLQNGLTDAFSDSHMGLTAENVAEKYGVTRQEMDEYSVASHHKAAEIAQQDFFKDEMINVEINGKTICQDENIRPDTNLAALSKLKPVFKKDGNVTAGNSSPLSDGASMVILATAEKVAELNLQPLARLGAFAESGNDPAYMGIAPYYAVAKLLQKTNKTINDYDVVEVNEAFAAPSVVLAQKLQIPPAKLNIFGGAIALGHPLAATGTRLVGTAINIMNQINGQKALVTLCIGGGQAIACEIERI